MSTPTMPLPPDQPAPNKAPGAELRGQTKAALVSFATLSGTTGAPARHIRISEPHFKSLLASLLDQVEMDEAWYAHTYTDVGEAIVRGEISSARHHYKHSGYFEDRLPRPICVDTEWYLAKYPDVRRAVRDGLYASAQEHFERYGFREGRLPFSGWTL